LRQLKADKQHDIILIDSPPGVARVTLNALMVADLVLMPVVPSGPDVEASETTVRLVEVAKVRAMFVLNKRRKNTTFAKQAPEAIADYGLPLLRSILDERIIHSASYVARKPLWELDPESPALSEMRGLAEEVLEVLA
jgi:chromosome partitioning protein